MTAAGVGKQHADFKEFFNQVYRGTIFALVRFLLSFTLFVSLTVKYEQRTKMKSVEFAAESREGELLDRIAQAHVTMYLGGKGLGVYLLQ